MADSGKKSSRLSTCHGLCGVFLRCEAKELQALSPADLDKQIKESEAEMEKAEKTFTDEVMR